MTNDELEAGLRLWGRWTGERPEAEEERDAPAVHAIARGMEFAPGKRQVVLYQRTALHRAGQSRRAHMATVAAAGVRGGLGMRLVPAGFVDPVPCPATRSGGGGASDFPTPPLVLAIDRAVIDLARYLPFRARCLRAFYGFRGVTVEERIMLMLAKMGPAEKAAELPPGGAVKVKRFRDEAAEGKNWVHARIVD